MDLWRWSLKCHQKPSWPLKVIIQAIYIRALRLTRILSKKTSSIHSAPVALMMWLLQETERVWLSRLWYLIVMNLVHRHHQWFTLQVAVRKAHQRTRLHQVLVRQAQPVAQLPAPVVHIIHHPAPHGVVQLVDQRQQMNQLNRQLIPLIQVRTIIPSQGLASTKMVNKSNYFLSPRIRRAFIVH